MMNAKRIVQVLGGVVAAFGLHAVLLSLFAERNLHAVNWKHFGAGILFIVYGVGLFALPRKWTF